MTSISFIKQLILQGENDRVDFKNTISNAQKIAKTLVAFANNKGGSLLIGVADDGFIKGIKNEDEEMYMIRRAATQFCKPCIEPEFSEYSIDDKLILKVTIPQSDLKPHYALDDQGKWWAYIRINDKSVLASPTLITVMKQNNEPASFSFTEEHKILLDYLTANSEITLKEFSRLTRMVNKKAQRILASLVISGTIKVHTTEKREYFTL